MNDAEIPNNDNNKSAGRQKANRSRNSSNGSGISESSIDSVQQDAHVRQSYGTHSKRTPEVLWEDESLIAINKPSGLLVHRSDIDRHETQFALQLVRDHIGQRVYPVHRLDKPTSGVLVFAKSSEIASVMVEQWRLRTIHKRYLAIVRGYMPETLYLDKAMAPPVDKYAKHEKVKPPQEAITEFNRLETIELDVEIDKYPTSRYSLVECIPKTGRKHQIRRHLKHLSHPIIGDARYGKGKHSRYFRDHLNSPRLLLHAWFIEFKHPLTAEMIQICAPLDTVFSRLVSRFSWSGAIPKQIATQLSE